MAKNYSKAKKVAVGISGGVDSSVAAALLKSRGFDVHGFFLECWSNNLVGCSSERDREDAVRVASRLNIPIKILDYKKEYSKKVINYFYKEYKEGKTPNPDIMCNREIKFGLFYDYALGLGFDYVATGHYARIVESDRYKGRYSLLRGADNNKDQSYFLYTLKKEQLSHILFPVGKLFKSKVRKIAKEEGLHTACKPDSQGICFVGKVNLEDFLKRRLPERNGDVLDTEGNVIGRHKGAWFYTIGQRRGFTITKYAGVPLYVTAKDVARNTITVGFGRDTEEDGFEVNEVHWINKDLPFQSSGDTSEQAQKGGGLGSRSIVRLLSSPGGFRCTVRIRHLGQLISCRLSSLEAKNSLLCVLAVPQRGVAPGQSAVFYLGEEVLGGGIITKTHISIKR